MPEINEQSTVEEVAAIVSDALENAGITAVSRPCHHLYQGSKIAFSLNKLPGSQ